MPDLGIGTGQTLKSVGKNISCREIHLKEAFLSFSTGIHGRLLCRQIRPQSSEEGERMALHTVSRGSCIQNKKVYGWKRPRPQTSFNSTSVAFGFGVLVASALMSNTRSGI
jgi:hypothetical protein